MVDLRQPRSHRARPVRLSYVMITRDRRQRTLDTLRELHERTPNTVGDWDVWVVDNGSSDDTAGAVGRFADNVHTIRLNRNEGMSARNHALRRCGGEYVALIDDDSFPLGNAVTDAMAVMDRDAMTAGVVGRALLPDGRAEASAMPGVMIGCATVLRRAVLDEVGGFDPLFFRQAEEYDLSFRIWQHGRRLVRYEDLLFRHDKHSGGRSSALTVRMDLRNNAILADRYLPRPWRRIYRADWVQRYTAIARSQGLTRIAHQARAEAALRCWPQRWRQRTLSPALVEVLFDLDGQAMRIQDWAKREGVRRVVIADLSKNIHATWRGCREAGLDVAAIAENGPAFAGLNYRGVPVLPDDQALNRPFDGIVISNVNPAQAPSRWRGLLTRVDVPLLRLWEPRFLHGPPREQSDAAASPMVA